MPDITTTVEIEGISKNEAWEVLADFKSYPQFMDSVIKVDVDKYTTNDFLSTWTVFLNGCELVWTERDTLTKPDEIKFQQTDGDIETWEGYWKITETETGCKITLYIMFDIGIPSLADLLHPVGGRVIEQNCVQMLDSFKKKFNI